MTWFNTNPITPDYIHKHRIKMSGCLKSFSICLQVVPLLSNCHNAFLNTVPILIVIVLCQNSNVWNISEDNIRDSNCCWSLKRDRKCKNKLSKNVAVLHLLMNKLLLMSSTTSKELVLLSTKISEWNISKDKDIVQIHKLWILTACF